MIPGVNASLDHRVARSVGGTDKIDNLQWITLAANVAKGILHESEFIALCRRVATHIAE